MKIRKTIQIIAAVLSLALLAACSSLPTPVRGARQTLEEPYAEWAKQAVKICDQYLSFEISKTEARALAEELKGRADYIGLSDAPDQYLLLQLSIFGLPIDFSQFLDTTDAEIMEVRDRIKFYFESIPGYHIYEEECADAITAAGFDPADIYDFRPVGYKYDEDHASPYNTVSVDLATQCDVNRIAGGIRTYLNSGATDSLFLDVSENMIAVCSVSFSIDGEKVTAAFTVNADDGTHTYLFGQYSDSVVDLYRERDDVVEVIQCADPLTPDQAADFFLACLPE